MSDDTFIKLSVSLDLAEQIVRAGIDKASSLSVASTIVVVDESGIIKSMARMDGAAMITVQVAQDKAYTAAGLGMATESFVSMNLKDERWLMSLWGVERVAPISGGLPITRGDRVLGAIGVSGGTFEMDAEVAAVALSVLEEQA
jgi:uncharacterized protein GlcG (DUF336 family)